MNHRFLTAKFRGNSMKNIISNSACTLLALTSVIGASPIWAGIDSAQNSLGVTVKEPPERRVTMPVVDMPEHVMTRAIMKDIEDKKNQPIKDQAGNIHYIVTFNDSALPNRADTSVKDSRFPDWHDGKVIKLLHDIETFHQFSATHLYSLTISGFSAFLTQQQVANLRQDIRIKHLSQDFPVEFSINGIWNDINTTNSTLPWGVQAVGGSNATNGAATVYVIDSGIGPHKDLNVTSRWAAPNTCLIGMYQHSTFVAGIIGAIKADYGVVGVDAGVNIVSLAYGDNSCMPNSETVANRILAIEETKRRITLSGHVGVVNMSSNAQNSPITNDSIRSLITPNALNGYPGAFFVQSAGNNYKDACGFSFSDALPSDGAMVIGAMDYNGQPVQPLNGDRSFNNNGSLNFGPESGSNFGACVDAWAPGKKIKSTWMYSRYTGSIPNISTYTTGDGTSFAAPHIAGIAARLIETFPSLVSPAAIEAAVRSRLVGIGAYSQNLPVHTVNLNSANYIAQPTVEFKIGTAVSDPAPAPLGQAPGPVYYADNPFVLRYDSVGAQNCDLKGYVNGNLWYQVLNFQTNYNWGLVTLQPNQYRWDVTCRSTSGTLNTASASATISAIPPSPTSSFSFNGIALANGAIITSSPSFSLAYNSTNTTSCNLIAWRTNPVGGFLSSWYSISNFYPSYNWGAVTLEGNTQYDWEIDCINANYPTRPAVISKLTVIVP
jgi:hypothetical protein